MNRLKENMVNELNLALEKEGSCLRYLKCTNDGICVSYRATVVDKFVSNEGNSYSIPDTTRAFEIFVRDFFKSKFGVDNTGFSNSVVTITTWEVE